MLCLELRRVLPLAGGVERLVVGLRPDEQHPRASARDALAPDRAVVAVGGGETDTDDGVARRVFRRVPVHARLALGTGRLPRRPIEREVGLGEAGLRARLPAIVLVDRPEQRAAMLGLAGDEVVGGDVA